VGVTCFEEVEEGEEAVVVGCEVGSKCLVEVRGESGPEMILDVRDAWCRCPRTCECIEAGFCDVTVATAAARDSLEVTSQTGLCSSDTRVSNRCSCW
jgi:hypothetical protein